MLNELKKDLGKLNNPEKAKIYARFFKTGKGEYGEGDIFIGITVPEQRTIAKRYLALSLKEIEEILSSKIHEYRLTALLILVERYKKNISERKEIVNFYITKLKYVNNWDLVDVSADKILGSYLMDKEKFMLYKLASSENVWERRIAIISTFYFIKKNKFEDTLKIAEILLNDKHDLIHKAVGWMLREVGKRNQDIEEELLKKYYKIMPRTMLRYAIEKFDNKKKTAYMKK